MSCFNLFFSSLFAIDYESQFQCSKRTHFTSSLDTREKAFNEVLSHLNSGENDLHANFHMVISQRQLGISEKVLLT